VTLSCLSERGSGPIRLAHATRVAAAYAEQMTGFPAALAVVQFAPGADPDANLQAITAHVGAAVAEGASLVVLPEYSSYLSSASAEMVSGAQPLDGPFVRALGALSRRHGIHLVAGVVETVLPGDGSRASNTLVALDPVGDLVASYRKLHLYDAFGQRESDWLVAGAAFEPPQVFSWGGVTVGMQTCYDVRFPEVTRRIVDAGADVILLPAQWAPGELKEQHWRTLVTARAIENTVYVAAADHPVPLGVGASMVVDPLGVEIAALGEEAGVAVATVSADRIAAVRAANPALGHRRFTVALREPPRPPAECEGESLG
jgi:deaminated glutathione amidase